ncbi:hypothetical protein [Candidatus Reidiella endopervernicosa]|nr:hypothetical protein [Candidatus Reidiella endopervernicosa]QKQ26029.1 hypothetical protein HUE57_06820 [Candidatus Reidiella endopervernicosa]
MYGSILFDVEQNRVASTADRDHSQGRYALNNHPPMNDSRFSNDSDMYGTVLFDVDKPGVETVAQLDRRGDRRNNHPTMKFSNVC